MQIRIQLRVPEYGWTTQKVFHLLNFMVAGLRAGVFVSWDHVRPRPPPAASSCGRAARASLFNLRVGRPRWVCFWRGQACLSAEQARTVGQALLRMFAK